MTLKNNDFFFFTGKGWKVFKERLLLVRLKEVWMSKPEPQSKGLKTCLLPPGRLRQQRQAPIWKTSPISFAQQYLHPRNVPQNSLGLASDLWLRVHRGHSWWNAWRTGYKVQKPSLRLKLLGGRVLTWDLPSEKCLLSGPSLPLGELSIIEMLTFTAVCALVISIYWSLFLTLSPPLPISEFGEVLLGL